MSMPLIHVPPTSTSATNPPAARRSPWIRPSRLLLAVVLAVLAPAAGRAQDEAPPADPIAALAAKSVLAEEDRTQLKTWVEARIQAIATAEGAVTTAAADLRKPMSGTVSEAFRSAYVDIVIATVKPLYARVELRAAAQMVAVLGWLADVRAFDTLVEALRDERVAVRTAAAVGLRNLSRAVTSAGGDAGGRMLTALREAGVRETSPIALKMIYKAIDAEGADPARKAAAVLEILDARAKLYFAGNPTAWGADVDALRLADQLRTQLNDSDKAKLTSAVAGILVASVVRYADELHSIGADDTEPTGVELELRNHTEQQIEAAESLLANLVDGGAERPKITDAMTGRGGGRDPTQMKIQMDNWAKLVQPVTGQDYSATAFSQRIAGG